MTIHLSDSFKSESQCYNAVFLFSRTDLLQWSDMEGAKKVCSDDTEKLWVGKEELRAAHTGGGPSPCGGHKRGERWAIHRAGVKGYGPLIHLTESTNVSKCLSWSVHCGEH